jgi:hypothetical protein
MSKRVEFTECPVMTATFAAHEYAVSSRMLYDDGILHIDDLENRIETKVEELASTYGLQPTEFEPLLSSARMAARLAAS